MNSKPVLSINSISKRYGRFEALRNVTFEAAAGSIVALLGPNGAGKTTTFKCVLGVTSFDGEIRIGDRDVKREGKAARAMVGYLPQTPTFLSDDTCRDALEFLASLRNVSRSRVDELLEKVNLADQRSTPASQLSGGMRQRLALAAALLSEPPLLLLDEPTANLDMESRQQFHALLEQLRSEGKTIIVSTHFVEHIGPLADRVIVLRSGSVVLDKPVEDLWQKPGHHFTVYLNGTPPAEFIEALKGIGVQGERISPAAPAFEQALASALQENEEVGS
jgi:ABC-type multidrug transport system ATPase subunit